MLLRKLFLILVLGVFCNTANAQTRQFIRDMGDSIRYYKKNQKPRLLLGFDNRITFLGSQSVRVNGLKVGLNYRKFHYFLGLHGTPNPMLQTSLTNQQKPIPDTLFNSLRFSFMTIGFTYSHWATKHWYFESTAQLGLGSAERIENLNSQFLRRRVIPIYPASIGSKAFYMFTPWVGVGAGLGVRKALNSNSRFDGIFYSVGVRFLIGELFRTIVKKKSN
jgi:hypothetical protein